MHLSAHYALQQATKSGPLCFPGTCVRDTGSPRAPPCRWPSPTCALSCITQAPRRRQPVLACTPSPHLRARLMRFAPAVKPAPGVLRVLRRHNPFVGLAPRRRSRVPTQVTSEDGLGVPFGPLWLFTTAQPPRSASGQDTRTFLTTGWGKEDLTHLCGGAGVVPAVSGPFRLRCGPWDSTSVGFALPSGPRPTAALAGSSASAFSRACYRPLGVSPPGKLDGPGVMVALELLLSAKGINLPRDTTHLPPGA
jgi:hypothetical protein